MSSVFYEFCVKYTKTEYNYQYIDIFLTIIAQPQKQSRKKYARLTAATAQPTLIHKKHARRTRLAHRRKNLVKHSFTKAQAAYSRRIFIRNRRLFCRAAF